ncbi:hypothetical protein [Paractinoplanes atraurantiacus]|uniref:ABC-2 family transporter protein n=1 Tax=Paractinoplanes atraurantiacus TaxID=1036182 RepID=A0A285HPA6_9ACTN|nr:hypothetical protein [Actinoplanes atraurantiacus]SNY37494.1 hypothetical protein SAMN05421748_105106 [Actinoplanes atraurantiacus]
MILRAEWLKLCTVRGWMAGLAAVPLIMVALGVLFASGSTMSCMDGTREVDCPAPPADSSGRSVQDRLTFVNRELDGDGSITAKVGGLDGTITYPPPNHDEIVRGVVPWAKAGLMIKDGTGPGADYAAVMLTGTHGVRMQSAFTRDKAGPPLREAWLRLTRHGDEITGYVSDNGADYQKIDSVRLDGLPATARIGLFVTSPSGYTVDERAEGGHAVSARWTQATAEFSRISPGGAWTDSLVGYSDYRTTWEQTHPPGYTESGGVITVAGSGEIGPDSENGLAIERTLTGAFAALLPLLVVAALCGSAEFRHGMIRTTLAAIPRPLRLSAAKAAVIGAAALVTGLVAVAVTMPVTVGMLRSHAVVVLAAPWPTVLRVAIGTAVLLSLAALFAYGLASLLRRAVPAIVITTVLVLAPPILAATSVLPATAGVWLLRLTPGAAFAIQQSLPSYPQASRPQTVLDGYYPLSPWAGLGVLALYALAALTAATWRLHRDMTPSSQPAASSERGATSERGASSERGNPSERAASSEGGVRPRGSLRQDSA